MTARRGVYRRPFLALRRAHTEAVCRTLGLAWWDDPTNDVPGDAAVLPGVAPPPLRSQVRGRVVPALVEVLGPGAVPALARTADLLRDDADLLDALAADLLATAVATAPEASPDADRPVGGLVASDPGGVVLDAGVLAAAHPALRRRALRSAALRAGCPAGDLFAVHVDALDALVTAWRGQGPVHLPGDLRAARACGRLSLGPETTPRRGIPPRALTTLSTPTTPTPQE